MIEYVPIAKAKATRGLRLMLTSIPGLDDADKGGQRPRDAKILVHMKPKHVFILGGGSALGAYQIGARHFLEARGVRSVRTAPPRRHA